MSAQRPGIPLISDVEGLLATDAYAAHRDFNDQFLQTHGPALENYGKLWGRHPMQLWSRRWEYPFTGGRVLDYAEETNRDDLTILDAGSGVTYLPYMLCDRLPGAQVTCVDYDKTYAEMFRAVNENAGHDRVGFVEAMLQKLPLADASQDVICCVSVLEHTDQYRTILDEFRRVLKPGGLLVLTFDLSLDGKFQLRREQAEDLLAHVATTYEPEISPQPELKRLDDEPEAVLNTKHIHATQPDLLPWTYPWPVRAAYDLVKGRGWTGGFRHKAVYCLSARKPAESVGNL
jgi:SAM-dependent methyltransferase